MTASPGSATASSRSMTTRSRYMTASSGCMAASSGYMAASSRCMTASSRCMVASSGSTTAASGSTTASSGWPLHAPDGPCTLGMHTCRWNRAFFKSVKIVCVQNGDKCLRPFRAERVRYWAPLLSSGCTRCWEMPPFQGYCQSGIESDHAKPRTHIYRP